MLALAQGAWEWLATIPHLEALLLAAYVLYLLWIAGWIVLQKREPVATLSWVLSLAALPYLGLLIYYWLGPQKV
ncbi:PLDc N-terminal domain-containing protein, partial [Xanthomonas perforans]